MAKLPEIICRKAKDILFEKATTAVGGFRYWLYPGLPDSYLINPQAGLRIEELMLQGKSAQQIADMIYLEHRLG